MALGGMDIIMMLILPIHEYSKCFYLFVSSSISFSVSYSFPSTGLLHPWLNLFQDSFYAVVSGIVFLVSHADSLLLIYTNATDFWILILYTATLLNSLSVLVVSW